MTPGLTVLAVDDSAAIRNLLRAILEAAGHQVVTAEDVRTGLGLLESIRPDVILTDFNMPELTGEDFVCRIRAEPQHDAIPIFVISSERKLQTRERMAEAGANGWITKPMSPSELLRILAAVRPDHVRTSLPAAQPHRAPDPERQRAQIGRLAWA